jgi:hypothetical protein
VENVGVPGCSIGVFVLPGKPAMRDWE